MKNTVKVLGLIVLVVAGCSEAGPSPEQQQARHLNSLGVVSMDQHNYVHGRDYFSEAIQLDPGYATAYANLGISLYSLGQYDSSRVALDEALRLDADHLHAAYTLGLIYHAQGRDHELALSLFQRVARHDPDDPHVRYYLGRTHAKLGQVDSALADFRRVIELDATNVSAHYALAQTLRQNGEMEAWRTTLEIFNRLSQSGLEGISAAYQGQGKYGEAVADTPFGTASSGNPSALFETRPAPPGLADARFLTTVDADRDGYVDLLTVTGEGRPLLLRAEAAGFQPSDIWHFGTMVAPAALTLADIDSDGDSDIALGGEHATIARWDSTGFQPGADDLGACAGMVFGDADHDGDADIACGDGWIDLWSNDGTGRFHSIAAAAGVQGVRIRQLAFSDLDSDRDVDLVTAGADGLHLFSNNRDGTFADVSVARGLPVDDVQALAVADFSPDGSMDIAIVTNHDARLLTNGGATFAASGLDLPTGVNGLLAADLDNDGDVDLLSYGAQGVATTMWAEAFQPATQVSTEPTLHLAIVDADNDGRLDVITPAALYLNRTPAGNSLSINLAGLNSNPDGFGTRVEVTSSTSRQVQELRGGPHDPSVLHFGIGAEKVAEFIRVLWPSGVRQTELDTAATGHMRITEVNRKGTSCPILYAWDGKRFDFVSDFLGGGIIGYLLGPDEYYIPDTDEYLPLRRLAPTEDGRFVLQIGNQLEEVIYLDGAELIAVDHPQTTDLYPGERLLSAPPYPAFEVYPLATSRAMQRVTDDRGTDVTPLLSHVDDLWYTDFDHTPIHGYAKSYSLTLELGDLSGWEHPVLLAHGWVDYAHSSSNWAATERGLALYPPRLEARTNDGPWREVTADMGVPAGLPKMMLYDLDGVFDTGAAAAQLRITTNTPVYWDQFRLGKVAVDASTRVHRRPFTTADLHWRGYPAHEAIHGTFAFRYDYNDVATDGGWSTHGGAFTRYGEVTELVHDIDDRFVVMFHGDELTLEVSADSFPPVEPGWSRSFLFYADGFGKDMDYHSAHSLTVEPLPFHGMSRYPYGPEEAYPVTPEHVEYVLDYNTRWIKGYYR